MQLCAACQRHVKASPCPFCGETRMHATSMLPSARSSRAQLVASAALFATACARTSADIYGAPPAPREPPTLEFDAAATSEDADASTPHDEAPDAAVEPRSSVELYGAPPAPPNSKPQPRRAEPPGPGQSSTPLYGAPQ